MTAIKVLLLFSLLFVIYNGLCQNSQILLPAPQTSGGMPLMEALQNRQTSRVFIDKPLEMQMLSNLLWAAYGINRKEVEKRTVPSAMNIQEYSIYVFLKEGIYLFDAKNQSLIEIKKGDFRKETGTQEFVKDASVNLIYVADYSKMEKVNESQRDFYAGVDVGFICQNVYLFAASEKLSVVVRGSVDKDNMFKLLNLSASQKVVIAQSVGYGK